MSKNSIPQMLNELHNDWRPWVLLYWYEVYPEDKQTMYLWRNFRHEQFVAEMKRI